MNDLRSKNPKALAEYGVSLCIRQNFERAEKALRKSLEYDSLPIAYHYLGLVMSIKDCLDEAEGLLDVAKERSFSKDQQILFSCGIVKLRLGKLNTAQGLLIEALSAQHNTELFSQIQNLFIRETATSDIWVRLGVLCEDARRNWETLQAYRFATILNPKDPDGWILLAELTEDPEEFDDVAMRGHLEHPANVELRCFVAESLYNAGMRFEALHEFETIPGDTAESWVERITEEFNEEMDDDYNPWLGEYGCIGAEEYYGTLETP
ncbi:MAG: hypothetical protein RTU92_12875 [Candidatus Thorarchaeota archaeon]